MQSLLRGGLALGLLALAGTAGAGDETTVGISVEASTLGAGLSVGVPLGGSFNLRGVYHAYTHDEEFKDESGGTYDGEFDLRSAGLFADWHPFQGVFRFTAGLVSNGNQFNMTGTDDGTGRYAVGDCTYQSDPADPLRIDGTVDFADTAPYLGIGWGGNLNAEPGFFMTFDLGVLFSGAPDARLRGSGRAQNTDPVGQPLCGGLASQEVSSYPEFQAALREAEDEVNREAEDYELWPNVALGLGWRF